MGLPEYQADFLTRNKNAAYIIKTTGKMSQKWTWENFETILTDGQKCNLKK